MRLLEDVDLLDYEGRTSLYERIAVRAIILKDGKIALIKSEKYKELKFPGGGVEDGESDIDTLARETLEEAGLVVKKETVKEYCITRLKRRSHYDDNEIFYMESRYYLCEVEEEVRSQNLQDYEIDLGYKLVFLTLEEAIEIQKEAMKLNLAELDYVERELAVLEDLNKNYDDITNK